MKTLPRLVLLALALLPSCKVVSEFQYTPPEQLEVLPQNERVVNAGFDQTWSALISSVGKSFFAINEFEKASGLLTLQFTTSPFSESVTGGHCTFKFDNSAMVDGQLFWNGIQGKKVKIDFDGDYADYTEQYLSGSLAGAVNLIVTEVDSAHTRITVNTRFTVVSSATNPTTGGVTKTTFSWNSGDRSRKIVTTAKGEQEARVMQSTHYVEQKILDAIDEIFAMQQ
jgi:hypothetical protein